MDDSSEENLLDNMPVIPTLQKTPMVGGIPKLNLPITRAAPVQEQKPTIQIIEQHQQPIRSIYDSDQSQSGLINFGEAHENLISGRSL